MTTPVKILVLDDEVGITRITSAMLKMQKHDVTAFNNPLEALESVKSSPYALAVVDYMMPEMSGKEFIVAVKKDFPTLKFIMLSAKKLEESDRKDIYELGVTFLSKPFKPHELIEKVNLALTSH